MGTLLKPKAENNTNKQLRIENNIQELVNVSIKNYSIEYLKDSPPKKAGWMMWTKSVRRQKWICSELAIAAHRTEVWIGANPVLQHGALVDVRPASPS